MMAISPTPELTLLAISSLRDCRRSSAASVFIMAINATAGGLSRIRTHFSLIANQPLPALNRSGSCRRNHPRCRRSKRGNLRLKSFFERLFYMPRDEFGHLEHADLLLATKDHLQRVIGVDQSPLLLIL